MIFFYVVRWVGGTLEFWQCDSQRDISMERPVFQPIGTNVQDLDTPALVVDLAAVERNIDMLHEKFHQSDAKVRPHASGHQCPQIAHMQLEAGGTVGGIGVTTVGEAEVFSNSGFNDVLVANQVVTRSKIGRLCALAGRNRITVAVDNTGNMDYLSEAASASGVMLHVLVELDVGLGRCGVEPGRPALDLAQHAASCPGLDFAGLMAAAPIPIPTKDEKGEPIFPDQATLEADTRRQLQAVVDTRELIEGKGITVPAVSVSGTHNYDIAAGISGITEVQAGSYPLMDYSYCKLRPEFTQAAKILTEVISHPVDHRAVTDAGHKATGPDLGLPLLEGIPGAQATRFSAEHGILELEGAARQQLQPGEKVWLLPYSLSLALNQYDYIRAVRDGKLQGFWLMAGRGQFG